MIIKTPQMSVITSFTSWEQQNIAETGQFGFCGIVTYNFTLWPLLVTTATKYNFANVCLKN